MNSFWNLLTFRHLSSKLCLPRKCAASLKRANRKTLIEGLSLCLVLAALQARIKCILFKITQRLTEQTSWILEAPLAWQGGRSLKRAHCKTFFKRTLPASCLLPQQALIKCILFKIAHLLHLQKLTELQILRKLLQKEQQFFLFYSSPTSFTNSSFVKYRLKIKMNNILGTCFLHKSS